MSRSCHRRLSPEKRHLWLKIGAIREFERLHPDSATAPRGWYQVAAKAVWENFARLRVDFASADVVGRRTVFNIGGNKYRLIARVNYQVRKLYILAIMKHSEHTKGEWK